MAILSEARALLESDALVHLVTFERDRRVVLSVEGKGLSQRGLREHLVVHGERGVGPWTG